ncbi:hypothetical protein TNCV_1903571 [Trichonephila clavipes]|nr:hypothetical protein TNCV_1903571 [Trichonephila clavipes]
MVSLDPSTIVVVTSVITSSDTDLRLLPGRIVCFFELNHFFQSIRPPNGASAEFLAHEELWMIKIIICFLRRSSKRHVTHRRPIPSRNSEPELNDTEDILASISLSKLPVLPMWLPLLSTD